MKPLIYDGTTESYHKLCELLNRVPNEIFKEGWPICIGDYVFNIGDIFDPALMIQKRSRKITYPRVMRSRANQTVVRFTAETVGEVLVQGKHEPHCFGEICKDWAPCTDSNIWEIIEDTYSTNKHPFLNPDNQHYAMIGGVEAIEEMEKMFTREELMAWAKLTAMKYRLRIGNKDEPEKEVKKIKEYEAYYKYLETKSADK